MGNELQINSSDVENSATEISSVAAQFRGTALFPVDDKTTIMANEKCKVAFGQAQNGIESFGNALGEEAQNIRSIHIAFKEFDTMLSKMMKVEPAGHTIRVFK